MKYKLVVPAKELANRDQPLGPELFGGNLKEHYKQIQELAKITTSTTNSKKKQQIRHHPNSKPFSGKIPRYTPWPAQKYQQ